MASGTGLVLPEVLQDGNAKSWFKKVKVCAVANERENRKTQMFTNTSEGSVSHF